MPIPKNQSGRLVLDRTYFHGKYFKCKTCKTQYFSDEKGIHCNGSIIEVCPWCSKDSKPWTLGRGI